MSAIASGCTLSIAEAGIPLVLIRHGPTDWTEDGRLQGRADPPLSAPGREAVRSWRMPAMLHDFAWQASPLRRAIETAELLTAGPVTVTPDLIEMDWGTWEGRRLKDLRRDGGAAMAAMEVQGLDLLPPGGESPRMVQERVRPWLRDIVRAGRPVAAVTHKGVIRAILALATGWDMLGSPPARVGMGTLQCFRIAPQGGIAVERLDVPCTAPA
ncbi:MAG: histidine phosphatase family protein [Alphaproteobacteria bacterium]